MVEEKSCENCKHSHPAKNPDYQPKDDGVYQLSCRKKGINVPNYYCCDGFKKGE